MCYRNHHSLHCLRTTILTWTSHCANRTVDGERTIWWAREVHICCRLYLLPFPRAVRWCLAGINKPGTRTRHGFPDMIRVDKLETTPCKVFWSVIGQQKMLWAAWSLELIIRTYSSKHYLSLVDFSFLSTIVYSPNKSLIKDTYSVFEIYGSVFVFVFVCDLSLIKCHHELKNEYLL